MKLAILETGLPPYSLIQQHGRYPAMVKKWLSKTIAEAEYNVFSIVNGSNLPNIESYTGFIITGSRYSVLDNTGWMQRLIRFIQIAAKKGKPCFGICFGHQIMAAAHGATVLSSPKSWGIGVQTYHYDPQNNPSTASFPRTAPAFLFHQDQVEATPYNAILCGGNHFCPIGVLDYGDKGFSVQYHPEFSVDYIRALILLHRGKSFSEIIADKALKSLQTYQNLGEEAAYAAQSLFRRALQRSRS